MTYDWTRHVGSRGGRSRREEVTAKWPVWIGGVEIRSKWELMDLLNSFEYSLGRARSYLRLAEFDCPPAKMDGLVALTEALDLLVGEALDDVSYTRGSDRAEGPHEEEF